MKPPLIVPALLSLACLASCKTTSTVPQAPAPDADLAQLAQWMTGTFSSAAQARADPEDYFDIRLVMVPIWTDRADGRWLYVEQAAEISLDRPYRQRVYRLTRENPASLRSDVYTLPGNPLNHAGCWRKRTPLAEIGPEDLTLRDGCAIILLRADSETFAGATVGEGCASSRQGASYVTSDVIITPARIVSWDQGWDESGNQVWGATQGGYVFDRISEQPPV